MHRAFALALLSGVWIAAQCGETSSAVEPGSLMSIEQYAGIRHERPYVLRICARDGQLRYVGTQHTTSLTGSTVRSLVQELDQFRPDVLLIEGPAFPAKASLDETVSAYGEAGVFLFEGAKRNVPVLSLDIPIEAEMKVVATRFGHEATATFYGLRYVAQELSAQGEATPEQIVKVASDWLTRHRLLSTPSGESGTAALSRVAHQVLPFFGTWKDVSSDWFDPLRGTGLMGDIARFLVSSRDARMSSAILRELSAGRKVLAEAGASHVVMQEPAIAQGLGCLGRAKQAGDFLRSPSVHICADSCSTNN